MLRTDFSGYMSASLLCGGLNPELRNPCQNPRHRDFSRNRRTSKFLKSIWHHLKWHFLWFSQLDRSWPSVQTLLEKEESYLKLSVLLKKLMSCLLCVCVCSCVMYTHVYVHIYKYVEVLRHAHMCESMYRERSEMGILCLPRLLSALYNEKGSLSWTPSSLP